MLPFYHIYGLGPVLNATWNSGAPGIVMSKWDVEHACQLIAKHRVTFIYCPPPVILAFSKHPVVDNYDLTSLKWINSGAAPLGRSLVAGVWERLKIAVKQGYGLSETSPTTHSQFQDEFWKFQGSVGKLYPSMQAKVVDEEGKEVSQGEVSAILISSKLRNILTMLFHRLVNYWLKAPMSLADTGNDPSFRKTPSQRMGGSRPVMWLLLTRSATFTSPTA
jgi:acyl-coenzyme A synthetase/AMP-(fatty) acid ligase